MQVFHGISQILDERLAIYPQDYQHHGMDTQSTNSDSPKSGTDDAAFPDLRAAETWVFDLDNTLYPASCRLFDQVEKNMTQFIQNLLDCDRDEAYAVQKTYFREHGTTMSGLMQHNGVTPEEFLDFVHDIDLSGVPVDPDLDAALGQLPGRKIIFTNGSTDHADNITGHLGIRHHFEGVFDIVAANFVPKPARTVYDQLFALYDINPATAVMVEDMAINLRPAADLGMTTVWVRTDSDWGTRDSDGDHIHHVVDDLSDWLSKVIEA
jgi:putative hydrolase of the HAD superfamily